MHSRFILYFLFFLFIYILSSNGLIKQTKNEMNQQIVGSERDKMKNYISK